VPIRQARQQLTDVFTLMFALFVDVCRPVVLTTTTSAAHRSFDTVNIVEYSLHQATLPKPLSRPMLVESREQRTGRFARVFTDEPMLCLTVSVTGCSRVSGKYTTFELTLVPSDTHHSCEVTID
jgi:hypothetical protein